jgi:hypothetical protein
MRFRVVGWLLNHQGSSSDWQQIVANVRLALERIAGESNIDRVRVERLLGTDEADPADS